MGDATNIYSFKRDPKTRQLTACIDLVESFDDDGWYAHEFDFTREDCKTRVSAKIYPTQRALTDALDSGKHRWDKWD